MPIILPDSTPTGRTFRDMLTEFYARGFTYLDDSGAGEVRAKTWINDAMHDIDDQFDWPYLRTVTTDTAPIVIEDLRRILTVATVDNLTPLTYMDEQSVSAYYANTALTGTSQSYYITGGNTLNTFPLSDAQVTVRYIAVEPDMTADDDRPLIPDRYRMAIVDYAVASALMDKNNFDEAQAARAQGDAIIDRMRDSLLTIAGAADRILVTDAAGDW